VADAELIWLPEIERVHRDSGREIQADILWLVHELRQSRAALLWILARCHDADVSDTTAGSGLGSGSGSSRRSYARPVLADFYIFKLKRIADRWGAARCSAGGRRPRPFGLLTEVTRGQRAI
jgi:hypothetical protein